MSVVFYSSHCPNCRILQQLMDKKEMEYEVIDDGDVYLPIADAHHIMKMPFADVNGIILDAKQLELWIKEQ